jgi:hypothetical protein
MLTNALLKMFVTARWRKSIRQFGTPLAIYVIGTVEAAAGQNGLSSAICCPNQRPKDLQSLECKGCRSLFLTTEKRENFSI